MKLYKRFRLITLIAIAASTIAHGQTAEKQAVIAIPIADAIGKALHVSCFKNFEKVYKKFPFSGSCGLGDYARIHQFLFNEIVTIQEEERGDEVCVRSEDIFFKQTDKQGRFNLFWTLKKNLITFDQLKEWGIDTALIPPIPNDHKKHKIHKSVTLLVPHEDKITKQTYSAGTRFLIKTAHENDIEVYALNPQAKKMEIIALPRSKCLTVDLDHPHQQIKAFVKLVKYWANQENGYIPYLWGGSSFSGLCFSDPTQKIKKTASNITLRYYLRPDWQQYPYTGFDCSGLINRAARICSIPFPYKNTTAMADHLKNLTPEQKVHDGDLILFQGHVMIISDTKNNLVVEASGYDDGHGKVHEVPLNTLFKDINTTEQLTDALHNKKPLERLNRHGKVFQTLKEFKILRLASAWHDAKNKARNR